VAASDSSVGSFYAHFHNKEDVFAAVLEALGQKVTEVMDQAKASQPDALQGIRCAVESLFLFLADNPGDARILIVESSGLSPRLERVRRTILKKYTEQVCQTLELSPGAFSVSAPVIAARCLVGAVFEALCSWLEENPGDRQSAAEVARAVADFATGLGATPEPGNPSNPLTLAGCAAVLSPLSHSPKSAGSVVGAFNSNSSGGTIGRRLPSRR